MINYITDILNAALKKIGLESKEIILEKPKEEKFGDLSTNLALSLAKEFKKNPRDIAKEIIDNLEFDKNLIDKIGIAGAGFINFYISDNFYKDNLKLILQKKSEYGKSDLNKNKTANIEWVSANPTGPLHAGHGRHICLGKAIANLLEWIGYKVTREYYYNDAGYQMSILGQSIESGYKQIFDSRIQFRDDMYKGEYVKKIAEEIYEEYKRNLPPGDDFWIKRGEKYCLNLIKKTLKILKIKHDIFFKESSLYPYNILIINTEDVENIDIYKKKKLSSSGIIKLLNEFKTKNLIYKKDNAWWLKMKSGGFQDDKVIIKSDDIATNRRSEPTYRLPDMAYHIDKINRGYDLILDIFGSDHSDTYKEVLFGVKSAGYAISNIKVIIHQMVTFKKGEESVKMSKRSDDVYYLDDLIEDVGVDATQFFFVMRSANTQLDFDIELAKDKSEKNPVYYLQYAHARICGILRNAE
ncbi:MAG: arginine--tRNA ligase, partial [Bacteroidetes bacterium]|nr:arginine--tRNA ligase [Bacteroidota bacterium]